MQHARARACAHARRANAPPCVLRACASQVHYPFENKERFEASFPADFIAEGIDQTRGWFYTLTVLAAALFDKPAFKNLICNGLVLAEVTGAIRPAILRNSAQFSDAARPSAAGRPEDVEAQEELPAARAHRQLVRGAATRLGHAPNPHHLTPPIPLPYTGTAPTRCGCT